MLARLPEDPWGHEYVYRLAPDAQAFFICSVGRNGNDEHGGGDDVTGRSKVHSCSEYLLDCPPPAQEIAHYGSLGVALTSLVALLASLAPWAWGKARR